MIRLKNIRLFALVPLFAVGVGNADPRLKRCVDTGIYLSEKGGRNFETEEGYNTLMWAVACHASIPQFAGIEDELFLWKNRAKLATKDGQDLPNSQQPDYDIIRAKVAFPVFLTKDSSDFWKDMFQEPSSETRKRINSKDCTLRPPEEYSEIWYCNVGCYAPESRILFYKNESNEFSWQTAAEAHEKEEFVAALSNKSSLENFFFVPAKIKYWLTDLAPTKQAVIRFLFEDGNSLRVSPGHPIVDGKGFMRMASDLSAGDSVMATWGKPVAITSSASETFFGNVYNLDTEASQEYQKIIVAEGILNGTHFYQDLGSEMMDKTALTFALGREFTQKGDGQ